MVAAAGSSSLFFCSFSAVTECVVHPVPNAAVAAVVAADVAADKR